MLTSDTASKQPQAPAPESMPPQAVMIQMANRYRISQCIHVAAKLGIADLLVAGPKPVTQLAAESDSHAPSLYRLLRALASLNIFEEVETGKFGLTNFAQTLCRNVPGSLRASAVVVGEEWHWRMWGETLYSVQTGQPAFEHLYGMDFFAYSASNEEVARNFNEAMVSVFALTDAAILNGYDLSAYKRVVDVGVAGGYGSLIAAALTKYPELEGVLFDLPSGIDEAKQRLDAAGLSGRCAVVAGDFFDPLPAKGDLYILKNVIHDFDDEEAITILRHCREAMVETGKLLVVEMVVPEGNEPGMGKLVDVEALLMTTGGRERTAAEYQALFEAAGFGASRLIPTRSPMSLIEVAPA